MGELRDWIKQRERRLVDSLIKDLGFQTNQAEDFVHETGKSVLKSLNGKANLDLRCLNSQANLVALFNRTDIAGVARRVGIPEDAARNGLKSILPRLLDGFDEQAGRLGGIRSLVRRFQ